MSKRSLKIVFLDFILELDKPGRTGLSDVVWDMASVLIELGHDVHVVAPYSQELAPDPRVKVHTIKVPPLGYRWFGGHLWISTRIARVAHQLRPDVIHAPEYVSIAVYNTLYPIYADRFLLDVVRSIIRRPRRKPREGADNSNPTVRVLTVPGNIFQRLQYNKGNPYSFGYTQCLKWAARKTATSNTNVIATSKGMYRAWQETGSPAHLLHLIPYGVDPRRFFEVPDARAKLGIPTNTTLLLYVGRFSREKAVVEFVETVAACRTELRQGNVKIVLIGKGPQIELVTATVEKSSTGDIVTQLDWAAQADLPIWYSASDALLLPSYTEPFGRVILEAMICGTPIISSRTAGAEDHVFPGRSGYLFGIGDFDALCDILKQVASSPVVLRRLRSFTKEYATENLTWPAIVQKIAEIVYFPNV